MATLSVVVSAYNEETKLEDCLKSVTFADEIIVVDNESSDQTSSIARKYTKHIYTKPNNPMLNINKNFGFSKAKSDWILSLDADERVIPELKEEIKKIIADSEGDSSSASQRTQDDSLVNGYWIPRKNIIFGKWIEHGLWWPDFQLRLFRKNEGKFPGKHVHEYIEVKGVVEYLKNPLIHYNYDTISQYLRKMDTIYTESEVENFLSNGKQVGWQDAIRFPLQDFLKTFFAQQGYKDGLHGLVLSLLQAFYSFVVWAKIWEKQGFTEYNSEKFLSQTEHQMTHVKKELTYWIANEKIKQTRNIVKKLQLQIKRKRNS